MSLFKKPNRKFRQRKNDFDSDDDHGDLKETDRMADSKRKKIALSLEIDNPEGKTKNSLLSFDDEDDETEIFKIKKSNYSKRMSKHLEKERKKKLLKDKLASHEVITEDKKTEIKSWTIANGNEAEDLLSESEDANGHKFKGSLKSGEIPDAITIYAMKKQRQRAREMGDYIPIEDKDAEEDNNSRIVREDDNDQSDDDEPDRINFSVDVEDAQKKMVREALINQDAGMEYEDAADLDRWEEEQIRKGVSIVQCPTQSPVLFNCPLDVDERQNFIPSILKTRDNIPTEMVAERLKDSLTILQDRYRAHQLELDSCHNKLIDSNQIIDDSDQNLPQISEKFQLYQQLQGYVTDLVECLDLKVKTIDGLEQQMHDLLKQRSINLILRRQLDVRDQSDDFTSKIMRGITFEQDRAQNEEKLRRAAEREGRRMRRRKKREKDIILNHYEGMSTDDEEQENDIIKFNSKKDSILTQAATLFEDVVEEFSSISGIINEFSGWRSFAPDSYNDAYTPLCLVKIFTPYLHLQLLSWNPFTDSSALEKLDWYRSIVKYGFNEADDREESDLYIIPNLIEKVVLKKLINLIPYAWDPLSTTETLQIINLTKKLFKDYPTMNSSSTQCQQYLKAIVDRITKTLDQDVFVPIYHKEVLNNRMLGAVHFFNRQFWSAVKLFKNILMWHGIISDEPLKELALNCLLNKYLLMTLRSSIFLKDSLEKCQTIAKCLPCAWSQNWLDLIKGESALPQLQPFCLFLKELAKHLQQQTTAN